MSFILDAIAKSERERQQQAIPDARELAIPVSEIKRERQLLPYIIIVALIINVIAVVIWWQNGKTPDNAPSESLGSQVESSHSQTTEPIGEYVPPETPQVKNINSSVSASQRNEAIGTEKISAVNQKAPDGHEVLIVDGVDLNRLSDETQKEDLFPPEHRTETISEPETEQVSIDSASTRSIQSDNKTQSTSINQKNTAEQWEPQESLSRKIYTLSEVPERIANDLPSIHFNGHLFSKNKAVSYVMVDGGRTITAGQKISDELYLHEVTPTGVIVDFRGYLIEVGVLQNWSIR